MTKIPVAFKSEPSLNFTPTLYFEPRFPMFIITTERQTLVVPGLLVASGDFASVIRNIEKFGAKNYFTDHRTAETKHGFREIHFWSLKYTVVIRTRKN